MQSLTRTADGKAMLSSSNHAENIIWIPKAMFGTIMLQESSIIMAPDKVQRAVILLEGSFVVTVQSQNLSLWDCRKRKATRIATYPLGSLGKKSILNFLLLPELSSTANVFHVVAIFSDQLGVVWEICVPNLDTNFSQPHHENDEMNGKKLEKISNAPRSLNGLRQMNGNGIHTNSALASLKMLSSFSFPVPEGDSLSLVLSVDPVGWNATLSGSIDTYARDVVTSISSDGMVRSWTAKLQADGAPLQWLQTAMVDTGIKSLDLAKGSSMKKIALVDESSTRLTLWDIGESHLEYEERFAKNDRICDLDWTCTPDSQSILAIGFTNRVLLYCQLRFDYTKELPAWASFRELDIRQYTPRDIGDSLWLDDGTLVIGSGNQLFTHDKKVDTHNAVKALHLSSHKLPLRNIFDIVSVLNGPLPIYHPQLIAQSIFLGKTEPVRKVFVNLLNALKFSVPSDSNIADIESNLGMDLEEFLKPAEEEVGYLRYYILWYYC